MRAAYQLGREGQGDGVAAAEHGGQDTVAVIEDAEAGVATATVPAFTLSFGIADRIVVLNDGKIVQEGTYTQLSQQPGLLQHLLSYQITSEPDGEKRETPA